MEVRCEAKENQGPGGGRHGALRGAGGVPVYIRCGRADRWAEIPNLSCLQDGNPVPGNLLEVCR